MNLRDLLQEKDSIKSKAQSLWDKKEKAKRSFSSDEHSEFKDLNDKVLKLDEKIKIESEALSYKRNGLSKDKDWNKAVGDFSIREYVRGIISRQRGGTEFKNVNDGKEQEVIAELRRDSQYSKSGYDPIPERALMKRDAVTSGATSGGALISDLVKPEQYVEGLYAKTWSAQAGVRMLSDLQGNVIIPGIDDKPSFGWIEDDGTFAEQDMDFQKNITLKPKFAGAWQEFSIGIFYQSQNDSIESLIRAEMTKAIQSGIDASFINDDGADGKPKGLLQTSNIQEVDAGGATDAGNPLSRSKLLECEQKLLENNQYQDPKWLINSKTHVSSRNILRFTTPGSQTLGDKTSLMDNPIVVTNSLPSDVAVGSQNPGINSSAILFIPNTVIVGRWSGGLQLSVNTLASEFWKSGSVGIRVLDVCDIGVRRPKDIVHLKEIDTAL